MDYCELYTNSKLNNFISVDVKNGTVSHAYILCGQDELLLKYFAKSVSKHIITGHKENCTCAICENINKSIFSDVLVYPKGNSNNLVVEDINEIVNLSYVYPLESNRKVFILNSFELCTIQAQNKLLKTLEEPNGYVTFIITTTMPSAVLSTIKSRSKIIDIEPLSNASIEKFLLKNSTIKQSDVDNYVYSSNGTLTKAMKIVNDADFLKIKNLALNILVGMQYSSDVLKFSNQTLFFKDRISEVFDEINILVRDLIFLKTGLNEFVNNKSLISKAVQINYSIKALKLINQEILISLNKLKSNCNPNAVVDGLLLKMLEVKHLWK